MAVIGVDWLSASEGDTRRLEKPDDWVRRELEQALGRDIPIVPTLVGGAALPQERDLPATLQPLVGRHAIELHDESWNTDIRRLVNAFKEFATRLRDPTTTQSVSASLNDALEHWQRVPRRARMTFLIALGALVVIMLGVGFVIHWLLIGAAIAALVWVIAKFTRNARAPGPH